MVEENNVDDVQFEQEESFDDKKRKKGFYLIIILVQLIIAGFLIWKFVWPEFDELSEVEQNLSDAKQAAGIVVGDQEPRELGVMYHIENLTVNPKGTRGMRFAVFEFSLEVPGEDEVQQLNKYKTVLIDNYIKYFRSRSMIELSKDTMVDTLKIDVAAITNNVLGQNVVRNVYFTRFVLE